MLAQALGEQEARVQAEGQGCEQPASPAFSRGDSLLPDPLPWTQPVTLGAAVFTPKPTAWG